MILFFTDFGWEGPYVGQMHATVHEYASHIPIVDLMHDAPRQDPRRASYLLAALAQQMPTACCCVAVVDPGVGTDRDPIIMVSGERVFVGPDNGLFALVARRLENTHWYRITWRPAELSASFHGRDLFAPIATMIAEGQKNQIPGRGWDLAALSEEVPVPPLSAAWPDDLDEVIYIDGFGNCVLGRRADTLNSSSRIAIAGQTLAQANTFGAVPKGDAFWYRNSMGLVEVAVNQGSAANRFKLKIGAPAAIA